jgi:hypothetical protein
MVRLGAALVLAGVVAGVAVQRAFANTADGVIYA